MTSVVVEVPRTHSSHFSDFHISSSTHSPPVLIRGPLSEVFLPFSPVYNHRIPRRHPRRSWSSVLDLVRNSRATSASRASSSGYGTTNAIGYTSGLSNGHSSPSFPLSKVNSASSVVSALSVSAVDDADDDSAAEYVSRIRARRAAATAAVASAINGASAQGRVTTTRSSSVIGEEDEDEGSVVVSGSLSVPFKTTTGPKRVFPYLEVRPAHTTDRMRSASLTRAVEDFLKKTDHSMDGWEALCREKKKSKMKKVSGGSGGSGVRVEEIVLSTTTTATATEDGRRGSDDSTDGIPNIPLDVRGRIKVSSSSFSVYRPLK